MVDRTLKTDNQSINSSKMSASQRGRKTKPIDTKIDRSILIRNTDLSLAKHNETGVGV